MKKSLNLLILLAIALLLAGCSTKSRVSKTSAATADGLNASPARAQNLSPNGQPGDISPQKSTARSETKNGAYNSEITLMTDGFGNKVEKRLFNDHARLSYLTVRTPVNGTPEIEVYGHNGQRRTLPADMLDRALTGSGDEIADAAQIFEVKKTVQEPPPIVVRMDSQSLQSVTENQSTAGEPSNETKNPAQTDSGKNELPATAEPNPQPAEKKQEKIPNQ